MPTFPDLLPVIATTPPRIRLTGLGTPDWIFLRWDLDGYTLSVDYNAGSADEGVIFESLCEVYVFPSLTGGDDDLLGGEDQRVSFIHLVSDFESIEAAMLPFLPAIEPLVVAAGEALYEQRRMAAASEPTDDEGDVFWSWMRQVLDAWQARLEREHHRRLSDWAANPREGWPVLDDEELPSDAD